MTVKDNQRVPKTLSRRVADCESHVRFLHEAITKYETESDRYKQVASELRILVCYAKRNDPLLLDLMDYFNVNYAVHPRPDLPLPITMVDDIGEKSETDLDELSPNEIMKYHCSKAKSVPLREFINRGLSVYIEGRVFSHRELILAVAQQTGSSHEDQEIDISLLKLENYSIGGFSGYGASLRSAGCLVLDSGFHLIRSLMTMHGYQPKHLSELLQSPKEAGVG